MRVVAIIALIACLNGCVRQPQLVRRWVEQGETREIQRTAVNQAYRFRSSALQRPDGDFVAVRLECVTTWDVYRGTEFCEVGEWSRRKTLEERVANKHLLDVIIQAPLAVIANTINPRTIPMTYWKERFPGTERTEFTHGRDMTTHPVSGERVSFEGVGEATTDPAGVAVLPAPRAKLEAGIVAQHAPSGATSIVRRVERNCNKREAARAALQRTSLVFDIVSKIRLFIRFLRGTITPVGIVVSLVLDVVTGAVIDYMIDEMTLRCIRCEYEWDVKHVSAGEHQFSCPKCGRTENLTVGLENPTN